MFPILYLKGNAYSFCMLSMTQLVDLSYVAIIMLRYVASVPILLRVFIMNGAGFYQMLVLHLLI